MISTYRHRDLSHLIIYTLYLETNEIQSYNKILHYIETGNWGYVKV